MANPHLVFLYGPPAVGKLTVAKALAERRAFRVLHNHLTIDAVAAVLPFGTAAFWAAVGRLRRDLVESAAREGIDLVYTYVFAPGDEPHVDDVVEAFENAGGSVTFVQLVAPRDVLLERVLDDGRSAHGKIRDTATLESLLGQHDLYAVIPGRDSLKLDLSATSAQNAADRIMEHIEKRGG